MGGVLPSLFCFLIGARPLSGASCAKKHLMDSLTSFFAFFDNSSLLNGVLAFLGTVLGLPYIYLQYKASPKFWPVSAVNALPFIYVNLVKSNFATAALFAYYLFVAVQAMFFSGEKEDKAADGAFLVHNIPGKLYPRLVLPFLLIFGAIYSFVVYAPALFAHILPSLEIPTPQTPFADAFATALSFVSMWLLSKKYIQQWLAWVVVNAAYIYMYVLQANYPWAVLFFIYGAVAVFGYFNWRALYRSQQAAVEV